MKIGAQVNFTPKNVIINFILMYNYFQMTSDLWAAAGSEILLIFNIDENLCASQFYPYESSGKLYFNVWLFSSDVLAFERQRAAKYQHCLKLTKIGVQVNFTPTNMIINFILMYNYFQMAFDPWTAGDRKQNLFFEIDENWCASQF